MSEDFSREEAAFRAALQAEAGDPAPLEPPVVRARPIPWVAAAVAIVALAVGVVGLGRILPGLSGDTAASSAGGAAAPAAPEAIPASPSTTAPEVRPGWRWESFRDVIVAVPQDWGYDTSIGSDWCAGERRPQRPFVDLVRSQVPTAAILCQGQPGADQQALHLSFEPLGVDTGRVVASPFERHTRTIGSAVVSVVATAADAALAEQILDTATVVAADQFGCPAIAPQPEPVALPAEGGDVISCLYDEAPGPNLVASVRLSGEGADRVWQAIRKAPGGGGPDGDASQCLPGGGDRFLVLMLGGVQARLDLTGCTGNGLVDASAEGGRREVTADLCGAVLVDPVRLSLISGPLGVRCLR